MCGIFGIITNQEISVGKIALEGIKRLEYRGYDSCGIVAQYSSKLYIKKDAGKIDEIHKKLKLNEFPNGAKLALAHTRWATHGAPTKINSHPHLDCHNKIAVVHNGILENFIELKEELQSKGHKFVSETDTEIIPHLIEDYMENDLDFKNAIAKAIQRCEGAYGVAICHADYPNTIITVRKESPIVVGIEEGNTSYCASDIPAFLPYTQTCYLLDDDEMAVLKPGSVEFFDVKEINIPKKKEMQKIEWNIDAAEKGGYKHFMLKEIYEEPSALRRSLKISKDILKIFAKILWSAKNIYITAAGTSFYASLAGKFIITKFLDKYIEPIECSEFQVQLGEALKEDSVIIAVSQSGETIDLIEAIRWAKEKLKNRVKVLSITNVVGSTLTRYSDHVIITQAGPEIGVAATKTYCTQVLSLGLVALEIADLRKILPVNEIEKYYDALRTTPDIIENFLNNDIQLLKNIVKNLEKTHNFFFLARGISIATAKEGGLKLKEIACRFIEGYSAAHAKHGPISLVRKNFPIIFIAPPDETYDRLVGNVMEFKARGGKIISLVVESDKTITNLSDITIRINQPANKYYNLFSPITFIPALQLLAYFYSVDVGLDPDQPQNLAKTVTVH
ncbi:MAG: glutamine--fructose-6-phosphate transaminase (isomerizing) [Promethearchaeota archaeon]